MDLHRIHTEHRKRRRRRPWRVPVSARLVLDEHSKGYIGAISDDLFLELFRDRRAQDESLPEEAVYYIAITPWLSPSVAVVDSCSWTVLAVQVLPQKAAAPSTIRFPASSLSLQSFTAAVRANKGNTKPKGGFDVLALEIQPLSLDTIIVRVDANALQKHEEVQKKFGGGFHTPNKTQSKGKGKTAAIKGDSSLDENALVLGAQKDRLKEAVRSSLAKALIAHRNDLLPLPLPAHPITHVPFPPSKIIFCEPVDQGLISEHTQIIVDIHHDVRSALQAGRVPNRAKIPQHIIAEEDEDTSAEAFFSAVEGTESTTNLQKRSLPLASSRSSATSSGSSESSGTESDDSGDNIISLTSPNLPLISSGAASVRTAATPRPLGFRENGISTPGSVFSNYTATTARQRRQAVGRPFQMQPLVAKIPDDLLHPPPSSDEDDEARVFVDVKVLVRLGCFSGDWVKLVADPHTNDSQSDFLPLEAFSSNDTSSEIFRVLKVYGLADVFADSAPVYARTASGRRQSQSSAILGSRPKPTAYISPILFANLNQPQNVTITPLLSEVRTSAKPALRKVMSSSCPPIAKEVSFLTVPTPISTEKALQSGLFIRLKQYFDRKRRILHEGDFISITLDVGLSRMLYEPGAEMEQSFEELFAISSTEMESKEATMGVAWFKVGRIQMPSADEDAGNDTEAWGGAVSVEPMTTKMRLSGTRQGSIPPTISNPWQYYVGLKRRPTISTSTRPTIISPSMLPKTQTSILRNRVRGLLAAATSPQAHRLGMLPLVLLLYSTQRNTGKTYLATEACADIGLNPFKIDAYDIVTEGGGSGGDVKTEAVFQSRVERALYCGAQHTAPVVQHAEALTAERMTTAIKDALKEVRALIVTTTEIDKIPDGIRSLFTHELEISAPNEGERASILNEIVLRKGVKLAYDVDLAALSVKTAALVAGDLVDVVERAVVAREERLEALITEQSSLSLKPPHMLMRDLLVSGGTQARCVTKSDFDIAIDAARKNFADSIGAPKIPNVSWEDVGGLTHVKDAVMETIQLPLERPELFAEGLKKRSGILFYGPPGTGKTLLAKAIATEFSLNFISVKGPELLNMYIGESEANVRRVFQRARDARPCVVFFDELDSVAPKRGNQGDSGGVMDRIVSQLLAELDGMSDSSGGNGGVFVIGATNRPDLLDQALLRPGRFDKLLYLGIADTHDKQLTILEALTRKFSLHPDTSLRRVAEVLPFTYTGADLYALCSDAMLKAITRQASAVDRKIKELPGGPVTTAYYFDHYATPEDLNVMVTEEDFYAAQQELPSSVR
jgi:peroxin-6